MNVHRGMGLVNEVFGPETISHLHGNLGVGHVRYSTTGETTLANAQPLVLTISREHLPWPTTAIW